MARRGGLGKGLGALIPPGTDIEAEPGGLEEIPVASIRPNRYQPRDHFDEEALGAAAPTRSARSACSSRCSCARSATATS